ncbi:hypothetical protein TrRE_jg377 [Triparma retinervis]|nr:hypothetical protein TrRE_jg377 [Triparma retinervis]
MYKGSDFYWGPGGRARVGVVPGHEISAQIAAIGPRAAATDASTGVALQVGQMVVPEQASACGTCWYCQRGSRHKCDSLHLLGQGRDGGMAQYMLVDPPHTPLHLCPPGLPAERAALAEPLACSLHGVDRAQLRDGDVAVVAGLGVIGLGVVLSLQQQFRGRVRVIAADPLPQRVAAARELGAEHGVVLDERGVQQITTLTPGQRGADVYFECSGHPASLVNGVAALRKMGTLVHLGIWDGGAAPAFNWNAVSALKELTVLGSSLGGCTDQRVWPRALAFLASGGGATLARVAITHRLPLAKVVEAHALTGGASDSIKVVLQPAGAAQVIASPQAPTHEPPARRPVGPAVVVEPSADRRVEHVVLLQMKPGACERTLEAALRSYYTLIPGIQSVSFGPIFVVKGPAGEPEKLEGFTHMARIRFTSEALMEAFGPHPSHADLRDNVVDKLVDKKIVLDAFDRSPAALAALAGHAAARLPRQEFAVEPCAELPGAGIHMPWLGFGTWGGGEDAGTMATAVRAALAAGYRHFDLAEKYGNLEAIGRVFGEAIERGDVRREELFITSKVWNTNHSPVRVRQACEAALKQLNLTYFDAFLVHWPLPFAHAEDTAGAGPALRPGSIEFGDFPNSGEELALARVPVMETWAAMEELVVNGLTRSIGVSNFTVPLLIDLLTQCSIPPAVNQVELHPFLSQPGLVEFCQRAGIQPVAYSPLGRPGQHGAGASVLESPVLREVALNHAVSPAVAALAWAIRRGVVVIPKSSSPERLSDNRAALTVSQRLSAVEMGRIDMMNCERRYVNLRLFGPERGPPFRQFGASLLE